MNNPQWLLLVTNLPGRNQTLRMRIWRALKTAGSGSLRDGVYVLPYSTEARSVFTEQVREIQSGGGSAQILQFDSDGTAQQTALLALFDRSTEYAALMKQLNGFKRDLKKLAEPESRRHLATLRRDSAALNAIDFFSGEARAQWEQSLIDVEATLNAQFSPDEPRSLNRKIAHLNRKDYQGRVWATREHLWVDRVCSAWLIRRFIDTKAKFVWLNRIKDCPKRALGFDFDRAQFSHVGAKVTFEVLLASFGLEHDAGLNRLGQLVHYLDVGGVPVPEADGFVAIMTGVRVQGLTDDRLIKAVFPILDHLYANYGIVKQ